MQDPDVLSWRRAIAAVITLALIISLCAGTVILIVATGQWVLDDRPGWDALRAVALWASAYVANNLWSKRLQNGAK